MDTRTRPMATSVAGVLLALMLTACGGNDESATAESTPPASAEPTATASTGSTEPTESTESTGSMTPEAFMERLEDGLGDEGSVRVDMKMSGPVDGSAEGATTYGPEGSEMAMTMKLSNLPGGKMEMVVVDDSAYMSIPGVTPPGKFFEIDESHPAFGSFDMGLSPADSFEAFEAGLTKVEEIGADDVQGEETTHYRLHVDAEEALTASGQGTVPGMPEMLVYDVWLDSEDRMRRLVYDLVGSKLTLEMSGWGEEVTIEPPAERDIVEPPPNM